MAPTVILIRHAEAEHNKTRDYSIPDPPLTELGITQCGDLDKVIKCHPLYSQIELIVISPMNRTLETAVHSLQPLISSGIPTVLNSLFQENSTKPCDTGSAISTMKENWPQFNWDEVDPDYPSKEGIYQFSKLAITERGIAARKWLRERPEKVIAVVSHSGFLRVGLCNRWFHNADFRIFEFAEEGKDQLVEWSETAGRVVILGGGMGKSWPGVAGWETQTFPEDEEASTAKEKPSAS